MIRKTYLIVSLLLLPIIVLAYIEEPDQLVILTVILAVMVVGWYDALQKKDAILRDYPIVGHLRYILRAISPELQQYFVERNTDGTPFNKNQISLIKSRAEDKEIFHPFGTELDLYDEHAEWLGHSMFPGKKLAQPPRVAIGGKHCKHPYSASLFNISAMSFGALSANAIKALNEGAAKGGFYHNTGEGGVTPFHLQGGDIVLQIGTGNFGFRNEEGTFNDEHFQHKATMDEIKMIEIKLSQGAKPGHGGVLPAAKNTEEIAKIRLVKPHTDVLSPPLNPEIKEMTDIPKFVARVRNLSGNKPVGFKLCIGIKKEFEDLIDKCIEEDALPDFITVDASEGGTGAAPLEYSDYIGMKGDDALKFVHQTLIDKGVRQEVKIIYAGKVSNGFTIFKALCFGADLCNSARGFMFALGCIQSLRCHTDTCPTGVATQRKELQKGLVPEVKSVMVYNYHKNTIKGFLDILRTSGHSSVDTLSSDLIKE